MRSNARSAHADAQNVFTRALCLLSKHFTENALNVTMCLLTKLSRGSNADPEATISYGVWGEP